MLTLDWIVLGLFFLALIGVIVWVLLQKEEDTKDYFLAGRDATWIAIGASIFASNIGSEHLVGLAGAGASSGMAMAHWEMHGWLILVLGWVFVPFYARSGVFTMPEFLEKRFNSSARSLLSIISMVSYVLTKVAVTVYAGGVVFKDVFDIEYIRFGSMEIDFFWISAIGLVIITGLYTTFGGMKAVLYTSVLQTPVLLIGSIVILVLGLIKLGGWGEMMEICRSNMTEYGDPMTTLVRSAQDKEFPWTGVFLGSAIIGFWYWCTDQFIVQRVLSGRDQKQARRGTIFGAYLKTTPVFIFLIPGMIAYALSQKLSPETGLPLLTLTDSDAAFSSLVKELLPAGIKGIVVGGILAALMSSLASLFNSSAMLFTVDFYKKFKPNATEKHYVTVGRIATVVIVVLGVLWIPVMKGMGKVLYNYLQDVQSLLAPGIASVFLLGVFWKRTSAQGGLWGLIIGFVLGMFRLITKVIATAVMIPDEVKAVDGNTQWIAEQAINPEGLSSFQHLVIRFLDVNWLHYEIFLFAFCLVSIFVISLFTKKPRPEQLEGLTYGSATPEQKAETRATWGIWDVVHTIIICGIVIAFYIYFW